MTTVYRYRHTYTLCPSVRQCRLRMTGRGPVLSKHWPPGGGKYLQKKTF
mgnify:CR=1